jgi:hypothetical protein
LGWKSTVIGQQVKNLRGVRKPEAKRRTELGA